MAGGSIALADLGVNLTVTFSAALRGRPCRPSNRDQKIRVPGIDFASDPDVAVYCDPRIPDELDRNALTNPTRVVEVLSPATEGYDRGEKFRYYPRIQSLEQYVLVRADRVSVDVFTRSGDGSWTTRGCGPGEVLALDSIAITAPVDTLYDGVKLDPGERLRGA